VEEIDMINARFRRPLVAVAVTVAATIGGLVATTAPAAAAVNCSAQKDLNPGTYYAYYCDAGFWDYPRYYFAKVTCSNSQTYQGSVEYTDKPHGWSRASCPAGTIRTSGWGEVHLQGH
jgi:hypothetical protein